MKELNKIKLNVKNIHYANDLSFIEFSLNSINIIMGKNNIGKTNILKSINTNNKDYELFFLDLSTSPFNDLLKEENDINKEKISSNSYSVIKKMFEEQIDNKVIKENIINILKDKISFIQKNKEFDEIFNTKKWGFTLEINEKKIDTFLKNPFTYKGISFNNQKHDLNDVGLGHLRIIILNMLNYILKNNKTEKKTILLIDEPEAFLHPNLIKEVCNILNKLLNDNKITIVLSTHSPLVISELKQYLCNFRKLTYNEEKNEIKLTSIIDINNLIEKYNTVYFDYKNIKNDKNNSLIFNVILSLITFDTCRLFFADKIIGVEGMSEFFAFSFKNFIKILKEKIGDYEIIPFHGLKNIPIIYTLFYFFSDNFIILCDNDEKKKNKPVFTKMVRNLITKNYEEIKLIEEGELEDLLGIDNVKDVSEKVGNILEKEEKIDINDNHLKFLKYLKILF